MKHDIERNLGEQPIGKVLEENGLKPHDLVAASDVQLTHKMVTRAIKGRRLTPKTRVKVRDALNAVAEKSYSLKDLFSY